MSAPVLYVMFHFDNQLTLDSLSFHILLRRNFISDKTKTKMKVSVDQFVSRNKISIFCAKSFSFSID